MYITKNVFYIKARHICQNYSLLVHSNHTGSQQALFSGKIKRAGVFYYSYKPGGMYWHG